MEKLKLIVLRGQSASGKSTVAKELRSSFTTPTALIEQDYLRRALLGEIGTTTFNNVGLIEQTIRYSLEKGYNVIVEGILTSEKYESMFERILKKHPEQNYFYYFDISFEETLKRHSTKPIANEFGEEKMKEWYKNKDLFKNINEETIGEKSTLTETIEHIKGQLEN